MLTVRTSLRPSAIHGIGCFAEEPIKKGQVVWTFDPRLDIRIPAEDLGAFPPPIQEFIRRLSYVEIVNGRKYMTLCADNSKYMNHSDDPNLVGSLDNLQDMAARDIEVGEELTCNYYAFDLEAAEKLGAPIPLKLAEAQVKA